MPVQTVDKVFIEETCLASQAAELSGKLAKGLLSSRIAIAEFVELSNSAILLIRLLEALLQVLHKGQV